VQKRVLGMKPFLRIPAPMNFALIDYFHDMSLLRNNVDNSINIQRASSTLDSCVKIWTSRMDSVGTSILMEECSVIKSPGVPRKREGFQ
jgi:hypothetical protein